MEGNRVKNVRGILIIIVMAVTVLFIGVVPNEVAKSENPSGVESLEVLDEEYLRSCVGELEDLYYKEAEPFVGWVRKYEEEIAGKQKLHEECNAEFTKLVKNLSLQAKAIEEQEKNQWKLSLMRRNTNKYSRFYPSWGYKDLKECVDTVLTFYDARDKVHPLAWMAHYESASKYLTECPDEFAGLFVNLQNRAKTVGRKIEARAAREAEEAKKRRVRRDSAIDSEMRYKCRLFNQFSNLQRELQDPRLRLLYSECRRRGYL